mmetsp:Transcript_21265/g.29818  ORF Transcript_21265/g.29818 Transcript_21265/m.29818 type:complete len:729 (-) Transcript_21265:108-2294(-)
MKIRHHLSAATSLFVSFGFNLSRLATCLDTSTSDDSTEYMHFVAHNQSQTCSEDAHATQFDNQIRGVNLGGWMVLEPWITPSLFYQFLGGDENSTAIDIYTFCEILGPEEGNRQLQRHWETWVTEEIIEKLAESGAVNSLRLPVGDWMYKPYGPYIGCTDGALDHVDYLLDWAHASGLSVLIDIHGVKGSQNGFDNSGQSQGFQWTSKLNTVPAGDVTFEHWPIRTAGWMGTFHPETATYTDINRDNIQHALDVIQTIVDRYKEHPAVLGLEPVNEPWQYTPIEELKKFYWEGYLIVKQSAPYWKFIIHDSFRFDPNVWGGFMKGCPDRAIDTHIYQAWKDPSSRLAFYKDACNQKNYITEMENAFGPVVVGEWSLATDNCAMWLNGFNDNLPGFPRLPCKYIPCSPPYMGLEQPGTPVDPNKPIQGPYGTGMSGPHFGLCPVGRDWLKESNGITYGKDWMKAPPHAPPGRDASDDVMTNLAMKKINAFSGFGHGFYFWNFRTDVQEPHWSYMLALEKGWIPNGNLNDNSITNACEKEDANDFLCIAKPDSLDTNIRKGLDYVLLQDGPEDLVLHGKVYNSTDVSDMKGEKLHNLANSAFNTFWQKHKADGATCDFGGVAMLAEVNKTTTQNDEWNDDYISQEEVEKRVLLVTICIILGIMFGGLIGFCAAMRTSRRFNQRVYQSTLFRPLSKTHFFRKSFAGFSSEEYTEIQPKRQLHMTNEMPYAT